MSAKTRINTMLVRTTGHHLAKGVPGGQLADIRAALRRAERDLAKARAGAPKNRAQNARLPGDYDDPAKAIIRAVRPFTMTSNDKLYGLIQATRYVVAHNIPGDIVECGVWRGGSMHAVARTLAQLGRTDRELHLFDTFEGMTEPTAEDVRWDGRSAAELLQTQDRSTWVWAVATLDDVRAGFDDVPYPRDRIHFEVGAVEDTIPAQLPERIAILRLDTDWYASTKHELDHAYARLSPGGILIIDDYGGWAGSRQATDEFIASIGDPLLLHRMSGGRIAVKPFDRDR